MSTIQVISKSAESVLPEERGNVSIPVSQPPCKLSGHRFDLGTLAGARAGLWECTTGSFRRDVKEAEIMHVLSGTCKFAPDGGEEITINAGDTMFFPPQTNGIWTIETVMRKVYVVVDQT